MYVLEIYSPAVSSVLPETVFILFFTSYEYEINLLQTCTCEFKYTACEYVGHLNLCVWNCDVFDRPEAYMHSKWRVCKGTLVLIVRAWNWELLTVVDVHWYIENSFYLHTALCVCQMSWRVLDSNCNVLIMYIIIFLGLHYFVCVPPNNCNCMS